MSTAAYRFLVILPLNAVAVYFFGVYAVVLTVLSVVAGFVLGLAATEPRR